MIEYTVKVNDNGTKSWNLHGASSLGDALDYLQLIKDKVERLNLLEDGR